MLSKTRGTPPRARTGTTKRDARAAARALFDPPPITFRTYEDNGGSHRWTIVSASGETMASSVGFGSHDRAEDAARAVHAAAASASFERLEGDTPPADGDRRRDAPAVRDDLDAERWLDEGGAFSSER